MTELGNRDVSMERGFERVGGGVPVSLLLAVLLRERRTILAFATAGVVIGVVLALLKSTSYTSTFSFIPQSGDDQGRSGLASLAGQFGIAVGGLGGSSQPPQLYADLLATRGVLATIARDSVTDPESGRKRTPLSDFLKIKGESAPVVLENTIVALRRKVVRRVSRRTRPASSR